MACDRISSLIRTEWYCVVCIHCIPCTHSPLDAHLGCSQLLAIVNSAVMNMGMQILIWDPAFHSCAYTSRSSIPGSYRSSTFFFFWETYILFCMVVVPFYSSNSSVFSTALVISCYLFHFLMKKYTLYFRKCSITKANISWETTWG